jgi:hypothetical protein
MSAITVDGMIEREYLASRNPEQAASYERDKAAMRDNFQAAAQASATRAGLALGGSKEGERFIIRPVVTSIKLGGYRPFVPTKSVMSIQVRITNSSRVVAQEFAEEGSERFDLIGDSASSGGRLRLLATKLANQAIARIDKLTKL